MSFTALWSGDYGDYGSYGGIVTGESCLNLEALI